MANLKSLAKDTAIYGLSSIVARFINYLLVPIQTARFAASGGEYGIITNVYAYVSLLIILLTFGMETTFFRFMTKEGENPQRIYSTSLRMVGFTSLTSIILVMLFLNPIARAAGYADHPEYIAVMYTTVAIDAFTALPFAYLRIKNRPVKFATLKIANILLNIILNLLYLVVLHDLRINLFGIYDENFTLDVAFVFYINLICTVFTLLMLYKELRGITFGFDFSACKRMLLYTWPLLVMGLAGQLNQAASQIIFPRFYDGGIAEAREQLGIYGACIKIYTGVPLRLRAFCVQQQGRRQARHLRQSDEILPHIHPSGIPCRDGIYGHSALPCGQELLGRSARGAYRDGCRDNVWSVLQPLFLVQTHRPHYLGSLVLGHRSRGTDYH